MRTGIGLGLALLVAAGWLALSPRGQGQADAPREPRKITISGTGTVTVTPDTARISFAVGGDGKTFAEAVEACDAEADRVAGIVSGLRLDGFALKRGPIHLAPKSDSGPRVTRTFTVVVSADNVDRLVRQADKVLTTAIGAGATETPTFNPPGVPNFGGPPTQAVNSRIELYRADPAQARTAALKKAVADALANAKTIAGTAEFTIKDIVTLTDQQSPVGLGLGGLGMPGSPRGEVQGDVEVTVTVVVTCAY